MSDNKVKSKGTKRKADATNTDSSAEKKPKQQKTRKPKEPDNYIKTANSAYIYFTLANRSKVEAEYAEKNGGQKPEFKKVGQLMAEAWRLLADKSPYEAKAAEDKKRYQAEIEAHPERKRPRTSEKNKITGKKLFKKDYKLSHKESKSDDQNKAWSEATAEVKAVWEGKASILKKHRAVNAEYEKLEEEVKKILAESDPKAAAMDVKSDEKSDKAAKPKRAKKKKSDVPSITAPSVFYRSWDALHTAPAKNKKDPKLVEAYKTFMAARKKAWADLSAEEKRKYKDEAAKEKNEKRDALAKASAPMDTK